MKLSTEDLTIKKTEIYEITLALNEILGIYIELHNAFMTNQSKHMFQPINFKERVEAVEEIHEALSDLIGSLKGYSEFDDIRNEPHYNVLHDYSQKLLLALDALMHIQKRLHNKSEGAEYPVKEYKQDIKNYDKARKEYINAGNSLNTTFRAFKRQL